MTEDISSIGSCEVQYVEIVIQYTVTSFVFLSNSLLKISTIIPFFRAYSGDEIIDLYGIACNVAIKLQDETK